MSAPNPVLGPPPYASIDNPALKEWLKQLYVRVGQQSAPSNSNIFTNPMTTLGDTAYENATPAVARLPGNTSATKKFLNQTGTGAVSAAPVWGTIATGDLPVIPLNGGGTGQTTKASAFDALQPMTTGGDIICGGTSGTGTRLPNGTAGQVLTSQGTTVAPHWAAVTATPPASEVWVYTGNGYGATDTMIRRWTTVGKNIGSDITYADSANNAGTFTINTAGLYVITYIDIFTGAAAMGISVNSTQLTTSIISLTAGDARAVFYTNAANNTGSICIGLSLAVNDVVRAHTDGTAETATANYEHFRITRFA